MDTGTALAPLRTESRGLRAANFLNLGGTVGEVSQTFTLSPAPVLGEYGSFHCLPFAKLRLRGSPRTIADARGASPRSGEVPPRKIAECLARLAKLSTEC